VDLRSSSDADRARELVANCAFSAAQAMIEHQEPGQRGHQQLEHHEEHHVVRIVGSAP
jgi:hypothetical protein